MEIQISAHISKETKRLMEEYVQTHGVKKSHLIERALQHHLRALEELPVDLIIPPEMTVSAASGRKIRERVTKHLPPTAAMKTLFDE